MRLRIYFSGLLAGFVFLALPWALARDHNGSAKEDAAELLRESAELRSITAPGSQPFHLIASVHLVDGGKSSDGTYEMLWEKPDRFRVTYSFPSYREKDFFLEDKEYILRSAPYVPLMN